MAYRFGKASGGEIPSGACDGHGWEYAETEDGDAEKVPVWVARSLPGAGPPFFDSVRIGRVRPGYGVAIFNSGPGQHRVEHYEVLLDKGTWREPTEYDDEGIAKLPADAVACGHTTDGTPLYAAIGFMGDDHVPSEITEDVPGECTVLVSSNHDEHAAVSAPLAEAPGELAWTTANVWDNSGDTAYLENPTGTVVSTKDG